MVFEVMGATQPPRLVESAEKVDGPGVPSSPGGPGKTTTPSRPLPEGVINQLLRSAVSLQAEGVLRTAGALAGVWGGVLDRTAWIERDARDLAALAAAATDAKVQLPAGVDSGAGDPDHPSSVVEGLLAAHEELVGVLRQLAHAAGDSGSRPWRALIDSILARREEEILLLRAVGAAGRLPADESYVHGCPPRN